MVSKTEKKDMLDAILQSNDSYVRKNPPVGSREPVKTNSNRYSKPSVTDVKYSIERWRNLLAYFQDV